MMDEQSRNPAALPAGVIGLGLMGTSIAACLLASGHRVIGVRREAAKLPAARERLTHHLAQMQAEGLLAEPLEQVLARLELSSDYAALAPCRLVVESTIEELAAKHAVLRQAEAVLAPDAVIGSNTSAIPITLLQQGLAHPERCLGLHWAEPAHITRFLEIICGERTDPAVAEWVRDLSLAWGKEPGLLRRDLRGFITNRCFYALLREAFYLVDSGYCTVEDVDRSLRQDLGTWITFAGPFRFMDLTGIPAYANVLRELWPELATTTAMPPTMQRMLDTGAQGTANACGFYPYTPAEAKAWEERFLQFSYDIRRLADQYRPPPSTE
jgi:3-hydroxybutyryl-CoA dehydrogenase